jgi:DNA-binding response OmpR family regulator
LEADAGCAAISLFRTHAAEIDAVVLDVTLPDISGREVLEKMREIQRDVRVVIATAYGRTHALATMGGDQSLPYLRKPYQITELTDLLRTICGPAAISKASV